VHEIKHMKALPHPNKRKIGFDLIIAVNAALFPM
jgi:hypothetical protein